MEKLSFEQSIERLDQIVKSLESGKAPLEESMKLYEEGISLVRSCNAELEKTETKIKILQNGPDGKAVGTDFKDTVKSD